MYQIIMPNSVKKDMKKLDKAAVKLIIRSWRNYLQILA